MGNSASHRPTLKAPFSRSILYGFFLNLLKSSVDLTEGLVILANLYKNLCILHHQ